METRFVPDASGAWLVYDLGSLVLALPTEFRAAADAVGAMPRAGAAAVRTALRASGLGDGAPFAVLEATPIGLQVVLRGPATVAAGTEVLTGLGAEGWLERMLPETTVARLTVPGGEWTFTLAPPAIPASRSVVVPAPTSAPAPPPLFEEIDVTEIPDLEPSLPPAPAARDDKTVVVEEIARLRAGRPAGLASPLVTRPAVALSLELPDGSREPLDAVVLVGRAPAAPADASGSRLLRIAGDGDISRNHARVAVEGGTVVVTDLGSRNGTIVRIPGRAAQKLRDGVPTPVLVGTVIDLGGGGVELSVREG